MCAATGLLFFLKKDFPRLNSRFGYLGGGSERMNSMQEVFVGPHLNETSASEDVSQVFTELTIIDSVDISEMSGGCSCFGCRHLREVMISPRWWVSGKLASSRWKCSLLGSIQWGQGYTWLLSPMVIRHRRFVFIRLNCRNLRLRGCYGGDLDCFTCQCSKQLIGIEGVGSFFSCVGCVVPTTAPHRRYLSLWISNSAILLETFWWRLELSFSYRNWSSDF